jgi:hypothetical protein
MVFAPTVDDCEFSVTIEFDDEPYPAPVVYARELDTPLSHAEVGNAIEIRLRATGVESPETIKLNGTICKIVDWSCSILSKSRTYSPPLTVSSILVTTGDMTEKLEEVCRSPLFENGVDIQPFGDETGTLNLVGVDNPRLIWESDLIDGAPPVESVRILSEDDSEIIVQNPSLPELDFDPLGDHAVDDRVDIITRILSQTDLIISSEAITQFARAVDQSHEELEITVQYNSKRGDDGLKKQGTLTETRSLYYADENTAMYQVRFDGDDGIHYLRFDPRSGVSGPDRVRLHSVAMNRHWDSHLGEVIGVETNIP